MTTICLYIHLLFGFCGPEPDFNYLDTIFASPQPTFAQMEWPRGVDAAETTDGSNTYTLWSWSYDTNNPGWRGMVGLTQEDCIEARDHYHLRGEGLDAQEADPMLEDHRPECLPDGRGHPRNAGG
jgi:hypothetical protein